jgi:hypothetical protein
VDPKDWTTCDVKFAELSILECLRAAVDAGFRVPDLIRADIDVDSLRPRSDVQLLVFDLTFPDDPFASEAGFTLPGQGTGGRPR